jgi:ABC-type multidrug transport system fused ATPase/permease subunit
MTESNPAASASAAPAAAASPAAPIISIDHVWKYFGALPALQDVSLDIAPGERVGHHRPFRLRQIHPAALHQPPGRN